jgi:hypothetical protein
MLRTTLRAPAAILVAVLFIVTVAAPASATITIELQNSFIDKYANRATIDVPKFMVDVAAPRPHTAASDGDMHAAGHSASDVGFATVVEIMNARDPKEAAADAALQEVGAHRIMGYWRLWPEHGGTDTIFKQFGKIPKITTTNPNHAFEIHPMLRIDSIDLSSSLRPIPGYPPKDATTAFQAYENARCEITADDASTTIVTGMLGYNYVKFAMNLTESPTIHKLSDGFTFFADVFDVDSHEMVAHRVRMVLAGGTAEAKAITAKKKGDTIVVLGLPRIDLSLVKYRSMHADASQWTLPYEMILAGIYPEKFQPD